MACGAGLGHVLHAACRTGLGLIVHVLLAVGLKEYMLSLVPVPDWHYALDLANGTSLWAQSGPWIRPVPLIWAW